MHDPAIAKVYLTFCVHLARESSGQHAGDHSMAGEGVEEQAQQAGTFIHTNSLEF